MRIEGIATLVGFNTGRLYQKDGQLISVAQLEDGTILFNDHSRMIWGRITSPTPRPEWKGLEEFAHDEYLHNRYQYDARAGMIKAESFPLKRM